MSIFKHRYLLLRFALIVILTLIIPTIAIATFLDIHMRQSHESSMEHSLRVSQASFLGRLEHEQEILANYLHALGARQEVLDLIRGSTAAQSRLGIARLLFSLQLDGSLAWVPAGFPRMPLIGSSLIDVMRLQEIMSSFAPTLPISRIVADASGLTIILYSAEFPSPRGRFVVQRHLNRRDLQVLLLSPDQQLSVVNIKSGRRLFSTQIDNSGQATRIDTVRERSTDADVSKTGFHTESMPDGSWYTLHFAINGGGTPGLIGEVSIPDDATMVTETARSFVTISLSILVLIIISSFILTQSVITPIVSLSYAVDSMRLHLKNNGPLVSIPIRHKDEVGHLARSINELGQEIRASSEMISEQRAEIIAYAHSLEERVQARTRELEDARMRAEIANQHKSKFLVNMNHELRTPLNSITGITDLLRFGAYEKHEEISRALAATTKLVARNKKVPKEIVLALDALHRGLETENNGTAIVLRYIQERLDTMGPEVSNEAREGIQKALDLCEEQDRHLFRAYTTIRDAGDSLLSIIDEVINLSRIESGVINIEPATVRIADILNNCMLHAEAYAETKHKLTTVSLSREIEQEVPEFVVLDSQKFKQVLLNLLTNAVKYTNEGYVHCRIGLSVENDLRLIHCSVQDSGLGISEKDREFMFMEFGRAFEVREIEGAGLGLAFSRKIVERHGGTMGYHSRTGEGSTFWFTIPLVLPDN